MIVTCDHCGAKYNLDPDKVQGRGARITCPKCTHVFTVYKEGGVAEKSEADLEIEPTTDSVDVYSLDFKSVGIRSWKVKVKIGLVYDFSDYRTLEKYIREGRVSGTDMLSYNGQDWVNIAEVGDLKAYFVKVYHTFKDNPLTTSEEKKSAPEPKLTKNSEDQEELNAAFAAVEAELTGEVPRSNSASSSSGRSNRSSRGPKKSASKNKGQDLSHLPKERNPLVTILVGLAVIGGGWFAYASMQKPPVVEKAPTPVVTEKEDRSEKIRAEIRDQIAKNAKLEDPDPALDVAEPSEEEWIPVVPAEILAQQGGNAAAVTTATKPAQSPSDHASEGRLKASTNDWNGAIESFQKAVDAAPNQIGYQEDLGEALYRGGQSAQAKSVLQRALNSGSIKANKWLGYISRDEGDIAGSNQYFQKYLDSNPPDSGQIEQVMRGG